MLENILNEFGKMGNSIGNVAKSGAAFLQTGKVPPNTPADLQNSMAMVNHLASKKFFIVFTSVIMLSAFFYSTVFVLLLFPRDFTAHVAAFTTIFSETMKVFGLIIASYLGVQTVADFAFRSSSSASTQGILEDSNQNTTQNITENENEHIIEEGTGSSPAARPYSMMATEE